jgi:hypothetical protein
MRKELSKSLPYKGGVNMQRAPQPTRRHPHSSRFPWIRAFLLEVQSSHLIVSIFKKNQSRNKRASRTEGIIRLLLIILWAVVVVVLGFYSGFAYHHH